MPSQPRTILAFPVLLALVSCGPSATPSPQHGTLTELSRVDGEITLCDHKVPEKVCTRHHPELEAEFKRAGDWCGPHGIPESQCFECHPDLTFEPLPVLPADADVQWLSHKGEDVPDLAPHTTAGKVTIFEFYAEWCAACRKVDGHIYKRIAGGDTTIAYRKLNIVSWESPLAQRYLKEVPSLPYIVVYNKSRALQGTLSGADTAAIDSLILDAASN